MNRHDPVPTPSQAKPLNQAKTTTPSQPVPTPSRAAPVTPSPGRTLPTGESPGRDGVVGDPNRNLSPRTVTLKQRPSRAHTPARARDGRRLFTADELQLAALRHRHRLHDPDEVLADLEAAGLVTRVRGGWIATAAGLRVSRGLAAAEDERAAA